MQTSTSSSTRPSGHDHAVDDLAVAIGRAVTATKSDDECPWSVAQHLAKALAEVLGVEPDQVSTKAYRHVGRESEPARTIDVLGYVDDASSGMFGVFVTNGVVLASDLADGTNSTRDISARELAGNIARWAAWAAEAAS